MKSQISYTAWQLSFPEVGRDSTVNPLILDATYKAIKLLITHMV